MKNEQNPIKRSIFNSIVSITGNKKISGWISGFANALSHKEGEEYSKWETFKIVLRHTLFSYDFWLILGKHFWDIITLIKCTYKKDYIAAINSNHFIEEITNRENVKSFLVNLQNNKNDILKAIGYIMNLPQKDDTQVLDKDFMKQIVAFLERNHDKISSEDITAFIGLAGKRKALEFQQSLPFINKAALANDLFLNNLEFGLKILEVVEKTEGFGALIDTKKNIIAGFLSENIPLNGMVGIMSAEGFKTVLNEALSQENIATSCRKIHGIIETLKEQSRVMADLGKKDGLFVDVLRQSTMPVEDVNRFIDEINRAGASERDILFQRIVEDVNSRYVMRMTQLSLELLQQLPETSAVISKDENRRLLFSQCFVIEGGKYKLSTIGKFLVSFGFMQFKNDTKQIDQWSIPAIPGTDPLTYFKVTELERHLFSSVDRNNTFITDLILAIDPDTISRCSGILDDLRHDKAPFIWLSKILQLANSNQKLAEVLVKHKDKVSYFVQNFSKTPLSKFGLSEEFISKVLPALLHDERSIKLSYKIFSALSSENYSEMTGHVLSLIQNNDKLREVLSENASYDISKGKMTIHEEIGNLMAKLGEQIPLMKEYFSRFEFQSLQNDGIKKITTTLLPVALPLLKPEFSILTTVDRLIHNSIMPNGISLSKAAVSVPNSKLKERNEALGNIYMWASGNRKFSDIEESIKVLKINTEEDLQTIAEQAKINDKAVKVCNEVLGIFKVDDVPQHQTQLSAVTSVIMAAQDKNSLLEGLEEALKNGNLSRDNCTFLRTMFNQSFDQFTEEEAKTLLARLSYELRIKPFEAIGVTKNEEGLVVSRIHSDLFFKLSEMLQSDGALAEPITKASFENWMIRSRGLLTEEDAKKLSGIAFDESKEKVLETLNDLAYRRRSIEEIGEIKDMLSSIFASFLSIENSEQSQNLLDILNTLVTSIGSEQGLKDLVNELIINKGKIEPEKVADKIFDLLKYLDQDKRRVLNHIILSIISEQISNPNHLATISEALKLVEDPKNDVRLEEIKDLVRALYVEDESFLEHKMDLARAAAFGMWHGWTAIKSLWSGPAADEGLVKRFAETVAEAKAGSGTVDIRGILRREFSPISVHALSGQNLGALDLSSCLFQGITFVKSDLTTVIFNGSQFIRCDFKSANLPPKVPGTTFDLESFKSFISAAEKQKLDISTLLDDVKVQTNITPPLDAKFVYTLMNFHRARSEKFSQDSLHKAWSDGITDLEILSVDSWKAIIKIFGEEMQSLNDARELKDKLLQKGLTSELMKKYSKEILTGEFEKLPPEKDALDRIEYICVKSIFDGGKFVLPKKILEKLKEVETAIANDPILKSRVERILTKIIGNFKDKFILSQMDKVLPKLLEREILGNIKSLSEDRIEELCEFLGFCNSDTIDEELSTALEIFNSDKYPLFAPIASKLSSTSRNKHELYKILVSKSQKELEQYDNLLEDFESKGSLQDNGSVNAVLRSWYLKRATGKMQPGEDREGKLSATACLDKALQYSQDTDDRSIESKLTKKIAAKLSGQRYLSVADRAHDLERIYFGILQVLQSLGPEISQKLKNDEKLLEAIAERSFKALYDISKREKSSPGNFYIPVDVDVPETLSKVITTNSITIESIIQTEPSLASHREELQRLKDDVLGIIESDPKKFAVISAVEIVTGRVWNGKDDSLHNEIYGLSASNLRLLLQFNLENLGKIRKHCLENKVSIQDIISSSNSCRLNDENIDKFLEMSQEISKRLESENPQYVYNLAAALSKDDNFSNIDLDIAADLVILEYNKAGTDKTKVATSLLSQIDGLGDVETFQTNAIAKATEIAKSVFEELSVEKYLGDNTAASQENLSRIIASAIFANIDVGEVTTSSTESTESTESTGWTRLISNKSCITSSWVGRITSTSGIINDFYEIYATMTSYKRVERCDDKAAKMLERSCLTMAPEREKNVDRNFIL